MWMMGCSDNGGLNISDSPFHGRKLRPLIPRPSSSTSSSSSSSTSTNATHPCLNLIHGSDLFMLNHHLALSEQSKRDFSAPTVVSSRWNPTPEQLQTLEELYRRGTRTPTADQIQQITAQLRRFGKIEGKNVFYWFQNHKARERQKRRRQSATEQLQQQQQRDFESLENKESDFKVEQAKTWPLPTNFSTLSEEARSGKAAIAERRTDGWIQFEERELQQRRRSVETHATWQMMQLSCSSSSSHLVNTTSSEISATTLRRTMEYPMLINAQNPIRESESHTLQLFPLSSHDDEEKERELPITTKNSNCTHKFFEFL